MSTTTPATPSGFHCRGAIAIITGASSGLGAEFARQLAPVAAHLVLAARSEVPMEKLAAELKAAHSGLRVTVFVCDLATDDGRERLWQGVDAAGIEPNLLINNAGLGDYGAFAEADVARVRQQLDLNIAALTLLTHAFLGRLRKAGTKPAGIINVSSLASALPIPGLSVYAATKAYVSSFSEGLRLEVKPQGIDVVAVCPGPTPTNFGKTARREPDKDIDRRAQNLIVVSPERVVASGLRALEKGKACVFPGKRVAFMATVFRTMPRPLLRFLLSFRKGDPR